MNTTRWKDQSDLPYEKFLRFGPETLTETELLAIILRTGTKDCSAKELAGQILSKTRYPKEGLIGLHTVSLEELMEIKGIGEVKAVKVKCIAELSLRMSMATALKGIRFTSSSQVASAYMEKLRHRETECVYLLCLDAKGQLISEKQLSKGSVRMSLISPREIFIEALQAKAVNVILLHNHPSGDPTPSASDIALTQNVRKMGDIMDIPLLDHIVIGDNVYVSFMEHSWFERNK